MCAVLAIVVIAVVVEAIVIVISPSSLASVCFSIALEIEPLTNRYKYTFSIMGTRREGVRWTTTHIYKQTKMLPCLHTENMYIYSILEWFVFFNFITKMIK